MQNKTDAAFKKRMEAVAKTMEDMSLKAARERSSGDFCRGMDVGLSTGYELSATWLRDAIRLSEILNECD